MCGRLGAAPVAPPGEPLVSVSWSPRSIDWTGGQDFLLYINSFQSIWPEHVMVCTTRLSDPSPSTTSATKAPNGSLLARFSPGRARSWLTRMENASFVPSASTRNVVSSLEPGYRKLTSVREFLTTRHDLYSAKGLVARAARRGRPGT